MPGFVTDPLPSRGVLALSGPDARSFLQGLVSNDVARVGPARAMHAALLTPQGKYLFDFFVAEQGDQLLIEVEADRLEALRRKLTMFRLRAKVTIEPSPLVGVLAFGDDAAGFFGLAGTEAGAATAFRDGVAFVDPRLATLGVRVLTAAPGRLLDAGFAPAPFGAYDRLRLQQGVPDGSRDLIQEKSILLESGFDELNGVDWKKGCYVGQELTARTKYRGLVKKRLVPVRVEGPLPAPGTVLLAGGKDAGEMRSGTGDRGLALVRLEALGAVLEADAARLYPEPPDWLKLG